MTNEFIREVRYVVLKSADVMQCLTVSELMQSQAKRVDDDLCRLTGMGAYKASPEAKP